MILGFADDIVILIRGKTRVKKIIRLLKSESIKFDLKTNDKKCGIIKIQSK